MIARRHHRESVNTISSNASSKTVLYLHLSQNPAIHRRFLDGMRRFAQTVGWRVEPVRIDDLSPAGLRELVRQRGAIGCVRDSGRPSPSSAMRRFCALDVPLIMLEPSEADRRRSAGAVYCDNAAIDTIAGLCGFGSEIELRRLFRRRFGMSMSDWRARNAV